MDPEKLTPLILHPHQPPKPRILLPQQRMQLAQHRTAREHQFAAVGERDGLAAAQRRREAFLARVEAALDFFNVGLSSC